METSLHRDLKLLYAASQEDVEVRVGNFRVDALADGQLVEIQHAGLGSIRDKVEQLLVDHCVRVVKPIVGLKHLVKRKSTGGRVIDRRKSPRRGKLLNLFDDLVHFTRVFPHPNLTLEVLLVEIEEWRYPGHGRRRRWRRRDHQVEDQKLVSILDSRSFQTAQDLLKLIPGPLPRRFDTADLAKSLQIPRHEAQKIAYCLRHTGAAVQRGKRGNALVYQLRKSRKAA